MKLYFNLGHRYPVLKSIESYYDFEYDLLYNFNTVETKVKAGILKKIDQYPVWTIFVKDQGICYYGKGTVVIQPNGKKMVKFDPKGKGDLIDSEFDENVKLSFVTLEEDRKNL